MDVRSLLLGSKLRIAATVLVGLGLVVAGAWATGALGVPTVQGINNEFGTVNQSSTVVQTDLHVRNPSAIGVTLGTVSVEYDVLMNDVQMAHGEKRGISLPSGNSTINFTTLMDNEKIPDWWVSHVRNGENTTLNIETTVHSGFGPSGSTTIGPRHVETDLLGQFNSTETRPVNVSQPLVSNPVLYINETRGKWGDVSSERTTIDAAFVVYNPKDVPITLSELGYNITMNDVAVGDGTTEEPYTIAPHSSETIRTTLAIQTQRLDDWWVSHLERGQRTDLRIDFWARIDLSSFGGGSVRVPLRGMAYEKTITTDIFGGSGAESDGQNNGGTSNGDQRDQETTTTGETTTAGDTTTDGSTTTATDETTTTDESTTTTTTGNTTTDDGILSVGGGAPARSSR